MNKTRDLTQIAFFALLLICSSQISIPMAVPFTLQTFGIFFILTLAGGKKGTLAILVYLLLGSFGLPVFAGFRGGLASLMGPTGGYLLGFLAMGLIYCVAEHFLDKKHLPIALILGLVTDYCLGTLWFMFSLSQSGSPTTFWSALSLCVIPFIIPDAIKLYLGMLLGKRLETPLAHLLHTK